MATEKQQRADRSDGKPSVNEQTPADKGETGVHIRVPSRRAVITERADPSLETEGWVCDKPYRVSIDIGAYLTFARPETTMRLLERQPNQ
jgi:hypothetical protein